MLAPILATPAILDIPQRIRPRSDCQPILPHLRSLLSSLLILMASYGRMCDYQLVQLFGLSRLCWRLGSYLQLHIYHE